MSLEVMKKIAQAEKKAEEIKASAVVTARQIESDNDAGVVAAKLISEAEIQYKSIIDETVKKKSGEIAKIMEQAKRECDDLRKKTAPKTDKAATAIYQKITA